MEVKNMTQTKILEEKEDMCPDCGAEMWYDEVTRMMMCENCSCNLEVIEI